MKTLYGTLAILLGGILPCGAQLVETNVALNKPTSGDVAFGFPTANGNDGSIATFNHADNLNAPPLNPFWAVDLQGPFDLTRIEIVDRNDACCDPNRLNGAEIRVYDGLGGQIGDAIPVDGFPVNNIEATATLVFNNNGAGWPGAASIRVDGYQQYFQFAELRAIALQPEGPPQPINVAVNGIARASSDVWAGTSAANLIDGNPASFVHPLAQAGTLGFTYTIDLFASYPFEALEIVNRSNCCPDRLSNYRVSLHENNGAGQPGAAVWSTVVRADGSNSGQAGIDTLTPDLDPAGTFAGRFITIENLNDYEYSPQIAEVRALTFDAPPANLATGKAVGYHDAIGMAVGAWGGLPATNIVDGSYATISHPLEQFSAGYYVEVDLGEETSIGSLEIGGRLDGCCPDRLTNATVEIRDGTSNTVFLRELPGMITEPVTVETGGATGRYVRVVNTNGDVYSPQLSELRVYPPTGPSVPFQITALAADPVTGNGTVTFNSRPGVTYSLFSSGNLIDWAEVTDNVQSDGVETTENFSDPDLVGANVRYYQIRRQ
jgi:hypothetical protein